MCKEIKTLTALSENMILSKNVRDAITWALQQIQPPAKEETAIAPGNEPAIAFIPLNTGEHGVTQTDLEKYSQLYPAVNIEGEIRAMVGWCDANRQKRKTKSGIHRFINSWMSRAQDKGGSGLVTNQLSSAAQQTMQNLQDF